MRILIVTDAWTPQVNGVVRTLQAVCTELEQMGHHVELISPDQFRSLPCPTYPEIRQIGEVTYYNDGDWVESCTALVEHADGRMEIVDWAARKREEAVGGGKTLQSMPEEALA